MEQATNGQRIDWPEYKKLKIAIIVWVILLAIAALAFHIWHFSTRGAVESKKCSVYFVETREEDNFWTIDLSTLECGKLHLREQISSEQVSFYESLVGQEIEVEVFPLQREEIPGTPFKENSVKKVEL